MPYLETPPLPKNRKILLFVAGAIVVLTVLVLVMMGEVIEKPRHDAEVQQQIKILEKDIARKEKLAETEAAGEVAKADSFDAEVEPDSVQPDPGFVKQEEHLEKDTVSENKYLKERIWGFWYIILPLFVVVVIFIFWVNWRHKRWTR